jgi:1,2-diacylglycerol 3-beta-galactosyltransferase
MQIVIRLFHVKQVRVLERFWRESEHLDMVVSLVPNFNRALRDALVRAKPGIPLITILTDIADFPPHFWIERQDQYLICGSEKAVEQATELGYSPDKIERVSGMILNPRFYNIKEMPPEARAAERTRLGFDPSKPVGIVLFGGEGSAGMKEIARRLPDRQLIFICGHNKEVAACLPSIPHNAPFFIEHFTSEIPRYMQIADYFIGKAGPGSISEAVAMRLPVVIECNAWTLPQERYNAEWVRQHGVGIVLRSFAEVARAVDELLDPAAYARFRAATERLKNRALFEIPDILERILQRHRAPEFPHSRFSD